MTWNIWYDVINNELISVSDDQHVNLVDFFNKQYSALIYLGEL